MLIALDAGHYLGTPGKRCLKSIDPAETREWTLNARIADKVGVLLKGYRCQTMRTDDVTGQKDVTLARRNNTANNLGAAVLVSFHHNAGINGGSGGGLVVYIHPDAGAEARVLQEAVYRHVAARTGLVGNRANPMATANHQITRNAQQPAVLIEFGFMDSTTDTPIILTEDFADQAARGVVDALAEVYALEKSTDEDLIRRIVREELAAAEGERAKLPASDWAARRLQEAKDEGITDGTRPRSYATREEVVLMLYAAK